MPRSDMRARITFITGTDTGVGKTVLTGLLVCHLRQRGCRARALKPFCSGSRADVEFLRACQEGELEADQINPFYFSEPVAPLVAARAHRRSILLRDVLREVRRAARDCDWLLIEGAGGLLAPLGEGYTVADLIARLGCGVIVVSPNKLGTINHTLLTARALRALHPPSLKVALMNLNRRPRDSSCASNPEVLAEMLAGTPLISLPFLGADCGSPGRCKENAKKNRKSLAQILK